MTFNSERGRQVYGQYSLLGYNWCIIDPSTFGIELPSIELLAANEEFSHYTVTRDLYWCGEAVRSFLYGDTETADFLARYCEALVEGAAIADQFNIARGVGPPLLDAFVKMNGMRNRSHVTAAARIIELYNAMGNLYDRREEILSAIGTLERDRLDSCFDQMGFVLEEFQNGSEMSSFGVYPLSFILAQVVPDLIDPEARSLAEKGLVPAVHEVSKAIDAPPEEVSELMTNLFGAPNWTFTKMQLDTELLGLVSRCINRPDESISAQILLSCLIGAPATLGVFADRIVVQDPLSNRIARIELVLTRDSDSASAKAEEAALSSEIERISRSIKDREIRLRSRGYFVTLRESLEDKLNLIILRHLGREEYKSEKITQVVRHLLPEEYKSKEISLVRGQVREDGSTKEDLVLDSITRTVVDIAGEIARGVSAISAVYIRGGPYEGTVGIELYCRILNSHLENALLKSGWNPLMQDRINIKNLLMSFDAAYARSRLRDSMLNLVRDQDNVTNYIQSNVRPAIDRLVPSYPYAKIKFDRRWAREWAES
jgi:hypothetical protein